MTTPCSTPPYELRIGVTGHRALDEPARVERAVTTLLTDVAAAFEAASRAPRDPDARTNIERLVLEPATWVLERLWPDIPQQREDAPAPERAGVRFTVISPIARGADRIVARAAQVTVGARLHVVTPFRVDEYRADFQEPSDRAEFEALLASAEKCVELPSDPAPEYVRSAGYLRAGQYVVDTCELLIAIWNGEAAAGRGGTQEVVDYALQQGRTVLWIDARDPERPVFVLRSASQLREASGHGAVRSEHGAVTASTRLVRALSSLGGWLNGQPKARNPSAPEPLPAHASGLSGAFVEHAVYVRTPAVEPLPQAGAKLSDTARTAGLPEDVFARWSACFEPHYERANVLAMHFQILYDRAAKCLYGLSALAVTLATVQVVLFPHQGWIAALEVLAILCIPVLLGVSKRETWHRQWLNDRLLAEQLRITRFVALAREPDVAQAIAPASQRLPFYEGPSGWMAAIADRLSQDYAAQRPKDLPFAAVRDFIASAWIESQASWHADNVHSKHAQAHRHHLPGYVLFAITFVMATLHLCGVGHGSEVGNVISVLAIVLPAWGAGLHAMASLRDFERIAARSAQMHRVLSPLTVRARAAADWSELWAVVVEAAALMETENQEWTVSLRYRDLALPA